MRLVDCSCCSATSVRQCADLFVLGDVRRAPAVVAADVAQWAELLNVVVILSKADAVDVSVAVTLDLQCIRGTLWSFSENRAVYFMLTQ